MLCPATEMLVDNYQANWCEVHSLLFEFIVRSTASCCILDSANSVMFGLRIVCRKTVDNPLHTLVALVRSRYPERLESFYHSGLASVSHWQRANCLRLLLRFVRGLVATSQRRGSLWRYDSQFCSFRNVELRRCDLTLYCPSILIPRTVYEAM